MTVVEIDSNTLRFLESVLSGDSAEGSVHKEIERIVARIKREYPSYASIRPGSLPDGVVARQRWVDYEGYHFRVFKTVDAFAKEGPPRVVIYVGTIIGERLPDPIKTELLDWYLKPAD